MGWFYGNNPAGITIDKGRIFCELMYAINEREKIAGRTETIWSDVGAYPAPTALAGFTITAARKKQLLTEIRTAIIALLTPFGVVAVEWQKPTGAAYTFASLCQAAFGADDFTAIGVGEPITKATYLSERLKATELLVRAKVYLPVVDRFFECKQVIGTWGTPIDAHAACEAAGVEACWWHITTHRITYGGAGDYWDYSKMECYTKHSLGYIPASAVLLSAILQLLFTGGYAPNTVKWYKISAAQYATPAWGIMGDLLHTEDLTGTGGDFWTEIDTPGLITFPADYLYEKVYPQATTPFPDDNTDMATGLDCVNGGGIRLTFTFTPTYN